MKVNKCYKYVLSLGHLCSDINQSIFKWKYPLWYSKNINAKGDYFAMNSKNMKINDFNLIEEYVR